MAADCVCYNVSRLWEDIVQMPPAIFDANSSAFADQLTASGLITWRERCALANIEDDQSIALLCSSDRMAAKDTI
jgi:hypothetical protein